MSDHRIRFGAFIAPFHPLGEDPTLALERDLELIVELDRLGFDEAWVGEHHSGGWSTVASPELMLAAAASRTRQIRLGTGVVSMPYHHPFNVASRIAQLDHLTRGRAMLGIGAGVSAVDARMFGIDPDERRSRMEEGLMAVKALLDSAEPVSMRTDWFTLNGAMLQLPPLQKPIEIALASNYSGTSMRLAGRHGLSTLALGGLLPGGPKLDVRAQWRIAEEHAVEHGQSVSREGLRIVMPIHLAETRDQAYADVRAGARRWLYDYFRDTLGAAVEPPRNDGREIEALVESGGAIVGTPDDCVQALRALEQESGGFGAVLAVVIDWTTDAKQKQSFEMLSRQVIPRLNGALGPLRAAADRSAAGHGSEMVRAAQSNQVGRQ
jgi:limonene 1,2-monooxygenase